MERFRHRTGWLLGIPAAILFALFLIPYTGWLIRDQLPVPCSLPLGANHWLQARHIPNPLPPPTTVVWGSPHFIIGNRTVFDEEASVYPDDFAAQLVAADWRRSPADDNTTWGDNPCASYLSLLPRFANEPSLYAILSGLSCSNRGDMYRYEADAMYGGDGRGKAPDAIALERARQRLEWAAAGERLDPDNAFFPYMRARCLYTLHRDREAMVAVVLAGSKNDWDDHVTDMPRYAHEILSRGCGREPFLAMLLRDEMVLLPHLSMARDCARFTVWEAVQLEKAGHPDQGLALRHALMHYGGVERAGSRTVIGSLVGASISEIAAGYPGGQKVSVQAGEPASQMQQKRLKCYSDYLVKLHHLGEARFAASEFAAGKEVRLAIQRGMVNASAEHRLSPELWLWLLDMGLLSSVLFVAMIPWLAGVIRQPRRRMCWHAVAWLAGLALVAWAAIFRWQLLPGGYGMLIGMQDWQTKDIDWTYVLFIGTAVLTWVALPAIILVERGVRLMRGRLSCPRSLLPLISILLLAYAGAIVVTAVVENHCTNLERQSQLHEGRFLAREVGMEWPGAP